MLTGEVALVTGASRGIGAAIAARLAADGARVIGTATTPEGAARVSEALKAQDGRGAVLEVTSQESIDALMADIESKEGPISILCNNAGVTRDMLLVRMKQEDWDAVIETNLASVFRLSKAVLRGMMKARKGRIISIASIVGLTGNPGQANYAAAKAGMIAFSKSLAREVGSRNITANIIAPGFIDTDMTRALNEAQRAGLSSQIPLGRLGRPADIAAAAAFLASEEAGYITGETLHVNGGMYMA
jgi:3-oxoacyl-[acyl-carrier protein] reductase